MDTKLLLVGCGKMGSAMLEGWLERGMPPSNITIVDPHHTAQEKKRLGISYKKDAADLASDYSPNIISLAVKPQVMDTVVPAYKGLVAKSPVFLSIAAGKPLSYFESILGTDAAIVRTMPNTPAAVRRGITVGCANGLANADQKELCQSLLEAVGDFAWIEEEALMDSVTALSGSGPAYVFLLAEVMAEAGIQAGLPEDLARKLARITVSGSGELMNQSPEEPATLRQNVTSPGGTTAAALAVLMAENALQPLMTKAIAAATRRSKELAG